MGGEAAILIRAKPLAVTMARHGRRRNFFAYPIEDQLSLSTLANGIVLAGNLTTFGVTEAYCISADVQYTLDGLTPNEGPIDVGLSTSDLTVTEIVEQLTAQPTSKSDIIAMERSRRPVRKAGSFAGQSANESLNDGKPIRTRLKFMLAEGKELVLWARNRSGGTLTTGATVTVTGTLFMRWV